MPEIFLFPPPRHVIVRSQNGAVGLTKRAVITGISLQDSSYLEACGIIRRARTVNAHRVEHLYDGLENLVAWYRRAALGL